MNNRNVQIGDKWTVYFCPDPIYHNQVVTIIGNDPEGDDACWLVSVGGERDVFHEEHFRECVYKVDDIAEYEVCE